MAPFMVLLEPEFMVSPATRVGVMGVQFYLFCARERNSLISWILCLHEEDGVGMNTDFQKVFDFNMQVVVNGNLKEDQRYRGSLGRKGMGLWYRRLCFGTWVEDSSFCLDFIYMNWKSWPNIHAKLLGDLITSFLGIHEDQFFQTSSIIYCSFVKHINYKQQVYPRMNHKEIKFLTSQVSGHANTSNFEKWSIKHWKF